MKTKPYKVSFYLGPFLTSITVWAKSREKAQMIAKGQGLTPISID